MKKDNRSLVQTVVALLAKLQEIGILKKYLFDINGNITNNLGTPNSPFELPDSGAPGVQSNRS